MSSDRRASCLHRRTILQGAAGAVLVWMTPTTSSAQEPRTARPAAGDLLVKSSDQTLTPLSATDVPLSSTPVIAWALGADGIARSGSRLNRVLLLRLDPAALDDKTRALAADGVVAYSAICTHAGCDVGTWLEDQQVLYCECHESRFDAKAGARVVDGPAPRSLPALPLKIEEGRLVVAGPFTSRVGFENGD